jgi:hypothetical protein
MPFSMMFDARGMTFHAGKLAFDAREHDVSCPAAWRLMPASMTFDAVTAWRSCPPA